MIVRKRRLRQDFALSTPTVRRQVSDRFACPYHCVPNNKKELAEPSKQQPKKKVVVAVEEDVSSCSNSEDASANDLSDSENSDKLSEGEQEDSDSELFVPDDDDDVDELEDDVVVERFAAEVSRALKVYTFKTGCSSCCELTTHIQTPRWNDGTEITRRVLVSKGKGKAKEVSVAYLCLMPGLYDRHHLPRVTSN